MTPLSPDPRPSASARLPLAIAFGVGLLLTIGLAGCGRAETPSPTRAPASSTNPAAERLADELAELRERNASARSELDAVASEMDRLVDDWRVVDEAEAEAEMSSPRPRVSSKPRPRKPPRKPPTGSPTTPRHDPVPVDDDRDPLAGVRD